MSTKLPGYLLFYSGIAAIILSSVSMYLVYSGSNPPVQVFHLPAFNLDSNLLSLMGYKNALPDGSIELIPASINNQFANLFAHLTLMSFFVGVGYKLSLIGAQILRPINIQVKETLKEVSAF